jgi:hypothetical protein
MLKKILATALAAAMILGLASVAFAASFTDTDGHARELAIEQLTGLGLLNGYGDGTFKPDATITRAEVSKMIVYAMGLKDAADMLTGVPVGFADVESNHWATGYISIAATQGIVKGYPDGTFLPQNNVTYAEILTMILRALGYGPALDNLTWPNAYIAKAAELKINKGISFTSNSFATRGDVAGLLANALTTPKLVQVSYGDSVRYVVSGTDNTDRVTLLNDMGAVSMEGWLVVSPDLFSWDDGDPIIVDEAVENEKDTTPEADKPFYLADGTECSGLLGHYVRVWLNNDEEVFFVEDLTPATSVKTATRSSATKVKYDGKTKDLSGAGSIMFRNWADAAPVDIKLGDEITVILDENNAPKYVIAVNYRWGVVDTVNATYERIVFDGFSNEGSITLRDYDITWVGAAESFEDLEEDDVVQYIRNTSEEKAILVVTRNSVTGTFDKLTENSSNVLTAYIDGVGYSEPRVESGNESVGITNDKIGDEVTILLNKDGKVVKMTTVSSSASDETYAVVVAKDNPSSWGTMVYKLKLFLSDGSEAELQLASTVDETLEDGTFNDDAVASAVYGSLIVGSVISYETNSSGKIKALTHEIDYVNPTALDPTNDHRDRFDIDVDYALIERDANNGANVKVSADTIVFDITDLDDPEVMDVEDLLANDWITGGVAFSSGKATVIAVTSGNLAVDTAEYAMVTGKYRGASGSSYAWFLELLIDDVEVDYEVASGFDVSGIVAEDVIKFSLSGGKLAAGSAEQSPVWTVGTTTLDTVYDEFRITDIDLDNMVVTIEGFKIADGSPIAGTEVFLLVDKDTLFYDITDDPVSLTFEELGIMSKVAVYSTGTSIEDTVAVLVVLPED